MLAANEETSTSFWNLWATFKKKVGAIQRLPGDIEQKKGEVILASRILANKGVPMDDPRRVQFRKSLANLMTMKDEANTVVAKIAQYLPDWKKAAGESQGLGVIPIVLSVAAIGALAFVVTKGLELIKQYEQEKSIIEDVKNKSLTLEEARTLIKSTAPAPLISAGMEMGLGVVALVALGGLYFFGGFGRRG